MTPGIVKRNLNSKLFSAMLVCVLVASGIVIFFPLTAPAVRGQVDHVLASAALEDMTGMPYDIGPMGDMEVIWDPMEDHIISVNYMVEPGMTLIIPSLNYSIGAPEECTIDFAMLTRIEVYGALYTSDDNDPSTGTMFQAPGGPAAPSDGIYFYDGSSGNLTDSLMWNSLNGVTFLPGSSMVFPGIYDTEFIDYLATGVSMDGVGGYTNIEDSRFDDRNNPSGVGLIVQNSDLSITNTEFYSHGPNAQSLAISSANVSLELCDFFVDGQLGEAITIDGYSNGTVLNDCDFSEGLADNYYIKTHGTSNLIENCSFDTQTTPGTLSLKAFEDTGVPSNIIVRQPTADGTPGMWDSTFDNSTLVANFSSTISLQWYVDVYVRDPDLNPVNNAPVTIVDGLSNPSIPPTKNTDVTGWARGFIITELDYFDPIPGPATINYNPFNVSAINNSVTGYLAPEESIDMSEEVTVEVPFSQIPNVAPIVSSLPTPGGVQGNVIDILFTLEDPNPGDDGNLSVTVFFTTDGIIWKPCTAHATSDPISGLMNDTTYTFRWDSTDVKDLPDIFNTTVIIRITPSDKVETGTPAYTLEFTVDNTLPDFLSGPTYIATNTTTVIQWTVNKDCDAEVWYGLDGALTNSVANATGSTLQTVTLTGLEPGRKYTYIINSTDSNGIKNSTDPTSYIFETEVHIVLKTGWNMISLPPILANTDLSTALASIAGQYTAVQAYDPTDANDPWKHYHGDKPPAYNDLSIVISEMAYWILMKNDAVLIPDQIVPDTGGMPVMVPMYKGWNYVGYPSILTRTVSAALTSIAGNYNMVQHFDEELNQWLWSDGTIGTLTNMEIGKGYWIHCTQDTTWSIQYMP